VADVFVKINILEMKTVRPKFLLFEEKLNLHNIAKGTGEFMKKVLLATWALRDR